MAVGTPFAFLQSATMNKAAAEVFYGAEVAGLAILVGKKVVDWIIRW